MKIIKFKPYLFLFFIFLYSCTSHLPLLENQSNTNFFLDSDYLIGPGDNLKIEVWENIDISVTALVRPDGKITVPLIEDVKAEGLSPCQLARSVERRLKHYIKNPLVSVSVLSFNGTFSDKIRVVGEAQRPEAVPFRTGMTLLDVVIQVGGLTNYAAGNRATLIRKTHNGENQYRIRLEDLIKSGDITANSQVYPGDIIIIPEAYF